MIALVVIVCVLLIVSVVVITILKMRKLRGCKMMDYTFSFNIILLLYKANDFNIAIYVINSQAISCMDS